MEVTRALEREGVIGDLRLRHARGPVRPGHRAHPGRRTCTEVVITDTIPLPPAKRISKIRQLSVAPLIGEAIRRIHGGESVGALFSSEIKLVQEMGLWSEGETEDDA